MAKVSIRISPYSMTNMTEMFSLWTSAPSCSTVVCCNGVADMAKRRPLGEGMIRLKKKGLSITQSATAKEKLKSEQPSR